MAYGSIKLTDKQQRVFDFYKSFIDENRFAPTLQEASDRLDMSRNLVHHHLHALGKKGYVAISGEKRGVKILESTQKIQLLGHVACGEPISYAYDEGQADLFDVPKSKLKGFGSFYLLKAVGDSMVDAGINDSDLIIIRQQTYVDDGDIAVVAIEKPYGEFTTLKRVYHSPDKLILKPKNDNFPVMTVKQGQIRGKYIGNV